VVDYLGQQALRLKGGGALLEGLDIKNGVIEFDIAVPDLQTFAGAVFRLRGEANYEHFYIRPHQSGNPDANQYQPVFNGVASWQLYHGDGYSTPLTYRHDEWMPVKIVFAGDQADVYIDSDEPVLHIPDLKHGGDGGAIGLSVANFEAVHFANFRYTELAEAYAFPPAPRAAPAKDMISSWQVSDTFAGQELAGVSDLTSSRLAERSWQSLDVEATGITNLARVQGLGPEGDTVFAMTTLVADETGIRELELGYSDKAAVYLNGTLIYRGDNTYLSRDYRYLGTIGLFDTVALPLKRGENTLCIAVTEAFGGWGLMARMADSRR
jgi:hypothetical protein